MPACGRRFRRCARHLRTPGISVMITRFLLAVCTLTAVLPLVSCAGGGVPIAHRTGSSIDRWQQIQMEENFRAAMFYR